MTAGDVTQAQHPASTPGQELEASEDPEPRPPSGVALEIAIEAGDWSAFADVEKLVDTAAAALARHEEASGLLGRHAAVVLADDAVVQGLNARFRGQDKPTNVLSFPFKPPPGMPEREADLPLGDIILAAETLRREADDMGVPPGHHLQHLVVHGLLHLLGFDHLNDAEAEEMEAIETQVLADLGIADPYAASSVA